MKKKSFYLWAMMLVAMLCVGFTSCGNDDDDDVVTGTGIVGTWQFDAVENHYKDGTSDSYSGFISQYGNTYGIFYKFESNGTGVSYEYEDGEWDFDHFQYEYDGKNTLYTSLTGNMEVRKLTSSELVLKVVPANTEDGEFDDEDVEYMIQTFKRVSDDKVKNAK